MSQAKVDRYKKEKANRKETMKKQKQAAMVRRTVAALVAAVLIGWCGYSGYSVYESKQPAKEVSVDYTAMAEVDTAIE